MTAPVIASRAATGRLIGSRAAAEAEARPRRVYGLSAVDDRGRLADRVVWRAQGWPSGTRLQIRTAGGLVVVEAAPGGALAGDGAA